MTQVEVVCRAGALNGARGPLERGRTMPLRVDIRAPALHRFDPATGRNETWGMPTWIGCLALAEPGHVVVCAAHGSVPLRHPEAAALAFLAPAPFDPRCFASTTAARGCDPAGRFLVGTMLDPLDPADSDEGEAATPLWRYEGDDTWIGITPAVETSTGSLGARTGARCTIATPPERPSGDTTTTRRRAPPRERPRLRGGDGRGRSGRSRGGCRRLLFCAVFGGGCLLRFDPDGQTRAAYRHAGRVRDDARVRRVGPFHALRHLRELPVPQAERVARRTRERCLRWKRPAPRDRTSAA